MHHVWAAIQEPVAHPAKIHPKFYSLENVSMTAALHSITLILPQKPAKVKKTNKKTRTPIYFHVGLWWQFAWFNSLIWITVKPTRVVFIAHSFHTHFLSFFLFWLFLLLSAVTGFSSQWKTRLLQIPLWWMIDMGEPSNTSKGQDLQFALLVVELNKWA